MASAKNSTPRRPPNILLRHSHDLGTRTVLLARLREHLASAKVPILDGAITPPQYRKSLELLGMGGK